MWMSTLRWPDIACVAGAVARSCNIPEPAHKKAIKTMQYLLHVKKWGITHGRQHSGLDVKACTDSDSGACLDT